MNSPSDGEEEARFQPFGMVRRAPPARSRDLPAAIEIYRRLLATGPDQKWAALYEPRYVLRLARLLELRTWGLSAIGSLPSTQSPYRFSPTAATYEVVTVRKP